MSGICLLGLLTFGLSFLVADSKLFGCPAKRWPNCDGVYTLLRWRDALMMQRFFFEQLRCYFCVGCWCAPLAHVLLLRSGLPYSLTHARTPEGWVVVILAGASMAFAGDMTVRAIDRMMTST